MVFHFLSISLLFLFADLSLSDKQDSNNKFQECGSNFSCGALNFSYPFWSSTSNRPMYCGFDKFNLSCEEEVDDHPIIHISGLEFKILQVKENIIRLVDRHYRPHQCPENTTFMPSVFFKYRKTVENLTLLYDCTNGRDSRHVATCWSSINGYSSSLFYERDNVQGCVKAQVQVDKDVLGEVLNRTMQLNDALLRGFEVQYIAYNQYCTDCKNSGGVCGSDENVREEFRCFCPANKYRHDSLVCKTGFNMLTKVIVAVVAGFVGILLAGGVCMLYQKRKKKRLAASSLLLSRNISSDPSSVAEDIEKGGVPGVHLFTYAELEEATNYFDSSKELGDGGFCTVYLGKLRDGRAVAVKRLYESNFKRVDQFLNEVEIITRLRHKNLVNLYGCTSSHSRELLLVYEFISNGTLADHIHGQRAKPNSLPWPIRLKIAVQTANALSYLHASDIIHRDVKTNNILLDDNFYVKVADFGLSRSFPTNVSHISTAPQGTPGYVDPDYHQCYQLTDKSDVYSFGVVLVELISSMPAVDITRHRHEINLSNMAISKIQHQELHELVDLSLGFDTDSKVKATMTSVAELAFQCLQGEKDLRPSMSECLDTLQRIQNDAYSEDRVNEMDFPDDDVILLKTFPFEQSPVSVTAKWESRDPTPNPSNL